MTDEAVPSVAAGLSAKQREKVAFIWSVKETLRDHYKRHQYQDVILPFCVLRRLDCVLEPTKDKVVAKAAALGSDKWDAATDVLSHVAGQSFWNASKFTFPGLLADQHNVRQNAHAYVRGFSPNARDALVRFGLPNQIDKLAEAGILYMVVKQFAEIELHPSVVSNLEMGYIYEELVRVTADLSNEEAGEHFTPREVIELMVNLLFADDDRLLAPSKIFTVYDPACGTGGMLSVAEDHLRAINPSARMHLFGQEVQPESYAVCKTDMLSKARGTRTSPSVTRLPSTAVTASRAKPSPASASTTCSPTLRTARTGRRSRSRSRPSTLRSVSTAASAPGFRARPTARSCSSSR